MVFHSAVVTNKFQHFRALAVRQFIFCSHSVVEVLVTLHTNILQAVSKGTTLFSSLTPPQSPLKSRGRWRRPTSSQNLVLEMRHHFLSLSCFPGFIFMHPTYKEVLEILSSYDIGNT